MKKREIVPARLDEYRKHLLVPPRPFAAAWEDIPETVRVMLMSLSGIQPATKQMSNAAGGMLNTKPSPAEVKLFREWDTTFQMIKLVMTMAYWEDVGGAIRGVPSSIYAVPAIKRDKVQVVDIDAVERIADFPKGSGVEEVMVGFDPFTGKHSATIIGGDYVRWARQQVPLSEIGFVLERYFLADSFDPEDVLEDEAAIPENSRIGFRRNRRTKLYTPFKKWESRQIWGLDSEIERFLLQELLWRGLRPELQWIIYRSGKCFPSIYDVYRDVEFRHGTETLTSVDLFFPEERVAVFCDGTKHHKRKKDSRKDCKINAALVGMGITPVRVSGHEIRENLKVAGDKVEEVVRRSSGAT